MNQLIEKANECQFNIYLAFIDYSKAFDSLHHSFLFKPLAKKGINSKYLKILKYIYDRSKGRISLEGKDTMFDIGKGVRHGDPLSPILFECLEEIFNNLQWPNFGLGINGQYLNNLRFPDDVVLIAKSKTELGSMIRDLSEGSRNAEMQTKLMMNDNDFTEEIRLGDRRLK